MASTYKYNRIDLAKDAIRLLRLLKGSEGQPIRCELFETYLDKAKGMDYEALSYVWGTGQTTDKIWLDGYPFKVKKNLYTALQHLRRLNEDRLLWVDAICIDQSYDAERGHQVGQMRLVYHNAHQVIVWFGARNGYSDSFFDWTNQLDQLVARSPQPRTMTTWENGWSWILWHTKGACPIAEIAQALRELLQREWFYRIWVLQEVAVAKSVIVACGHKQARSRTFVVMPSLLGIKCGMVEQARLDIMPGLLRDRLGWTSNYNEELLTLLQRFGRSKASDHRDIIYALIGLCSDAYTSTILRPNYETTLQQTIQKAVEYLLIRSKDLSHHPNTGFPTWDLTEFLDSLQGLTMSIFVWAAETCEDELLLDLLKCQIAKQDEQMVRQFITYVGCHGPLVTISIKKANLELFDTSLQLPGVDIRSRDSSGNTPLLIATKQDKPTFANTLLKLLVDKGARWKFGGEMTLMNAVKDGDLSVIELILNHYEADRYISVDGNGDGLLNIAVKRGDEKATELLLRKPTKELLIHRGPDGMTPLELAVVGAHSGVIRKLLPHLPQALHKAVRMYPTEHVRRILDAEPSIVDSAHHCNCPPIHRAAEARNPRRMALLLDHGATINSPGSCGNTPLWTAAARGDRATVRLLVHRGAEKEVVGKYRGLIGTPLSVAASRGDVAIAVDLLAAGADVQACQSLHIDNENSMRIKSRTVCWAAICQGNTEIVEKLAKGGEDIEETVKGWSLGSELQRFVSGDATPIWVAASLGHTSIVDLLIQQGANIEARDGYFGMTPYWAASYYNREAAMLALIRGGADVREPHCSRCMSMAPH